MPQFERRLYEPSGDAGVFDAGEDGLDEEGSRLPLLIVIALVVLASFAGVVWLAYTQGVQRGREDAPRVVAAPQSEKVASQSKAANPYSNLKIYQPPSADEDEDSAPEPPTPVAPKAVPKPPPVSTEKPAVATAPPKPAAAPAATLPSKTASASTSAPSRTTIKPTITAKSPATPATKPKAVVSTPTPVAKSPSRLATTAPRSIAPPPVAVTKPAPKVAPALTKAPPVVVPKVPPAVAKPVPSATQSAAEAPKTQTAVSTPAPTPTQTAAPPTTVSKPAQTAATESTPAAASGEYVLQIGSYKSEAEANSSWQAYKGAHPAASGFAPNVRRAELGAKGTWYRLRVGPFASLSEANAACAKLKASGGSCFPAKQ